MRLAILALLGTITPALGAPSCHRHDLTWRTDAKAGDFNGMSHSGTMLVLHNSGKTACTLPRRPGIALSAADGRTIDTRTIPAAGGTGTRQRNTGSLDLAAGEDARASLRWVSGPVYDRAHCVDATHLLLRLPDGGPDSRIDGPLNAHLCGRPGQPIEIEQGDLTTATP